MQRAKLAAALIMVALLLPLFLAPTPWHVMIARAQGPPWIGSQIFIENGYNTSQDTTALGFAKGTSGPVTLSFEDILTFGSSSESTIIGCTPENVSVYTSVGSSQTGFYPSSAQFTVPYCYMEYLPSGGVEIILYGTITFSGPGYTGVEYSFYISPVLHLTFLTGNKTVSGLYAFPSPSVTVEKVQPSSLQVSVSSNINYAVVPANPSVEEDITIEPAYQANATVSWSPVVTAGTYVNITCQLNGNTVFTQDNYYVSGGSISSTFGPIPIIGNGGTLTCVFVSGKNFLGAVSTSTGNISASNSLGYAQLMILMPYISTTSQGYYDLNFSAYVYNLTNAQLTINIYVNQSQVGTMAATEPGMYYYSYQLSNYNPLSVNQPPLVGYYQVVFTPDNGNSVTFNVTFKITNAYMALANVIDIAFYVALGLMLAVGFILMVFGFLLGQKMLIQGGIVTLFAAVLLAMLPTLMGYLLLILLESGVSNPIGLTPDITFDNIGYYVAKSTSYVALMANSFSSQASNTAWAVIGVAAGATVGSFFTAGGLSGLASMLFQMALGLLLAANVLHILAAIFAPLLTITIVVMMLSIVLQILIAIVSGNIEPAMQSIMELVSLIFFLLLSPIIVATAAAYTKAASTIHIWIFSFPNPTGSLAAVMIMLMIIVAILVLALKSLLGAVGSFGNLGSLLPL